jgi:nucleoside-diphosphate kinase
MQDTYTMIKPEAVAAGKVGTILGQIEANGFRIERLQTLTMSREMAEKFYDVHKDRPFFGELVQYITSGPVVAIHLRRDDAVKRLRELVGATDPAEAACGTVRFLHGTDLQRNAIHASDSPENGQRELSIVFGSAS